MLALKLKFLNGTLTWKIGVVIDYWIFCGATNIGELLSNKVVAITTNVVVGFILCAKH